MLQKGRTDVRPRFSFKVQLHIAVVITKVLRLRLTFYYKDEVKAFFNTQVRH